jgi:hypothetical protein
MKQVTSVSLIGVSLALIIAACQSAPTDLGNDAENSANSGKSQQRFFTIANPAIAYIDTTVIGNGSHRAYYNTIKVMDADGSNKKIVYTGPSIGSTVATPVALTPGGLPSWASTGSGTQSSPWRMAFTEHPSNSSYTGTWSIKALDVYVNSSGVPIGSNVQTVTSFSDGRYPKGAAWRPGYNEIAFTSVRDRTSGGGTAYGEIYITDLSGNVSRLYPASGDPSATYATTWPAWSPTGDTLAFALQNTSGDGGSCTIILIKRDGTFLGTYLSSGGFYLIDGIDWSRNGTIAFAAQIATAYNTNGTPVLSSRAIYTLDPSTGTTTQQFVGGQPSYSFDALQFAYLGNGEISKRNVGASSYTTLSAGLYCSRPSWR